MMAQVGGIGAMVLLTLLAGLGCGLVAWVLKHWLGWVGALTFGGLCWSLVVIALVTLLPIAQIDLAIPAETRSDSCSFDYGGPAPEGFWIFSGTQRALNTVLFVPAGALMVLTLARWRGWWALVPFGLAALAAYSVAIEVVQLEVARIGRACDVTDMVDNITGAVLGVLVGLLLVPVLLPWLRRRGRTAG